MEKRRNSRIVFNGNVAVTRADGRDCPGTLTDVSLSGIHVIVEPPLTVGECCEVTLELDVGIAIRFKGEVIRNDASDNGAGVRITGIDLENLQHLVRLVVLNKGDRDIIISELIDESFHAADAT